MHTIIPNHPQPKCTKIAFVMVYEEYTISFNQFGQRLGRYEAEEGREQQFYCTFFTEDRVIVSLKGDTTLLLHYDMTEDRVINENRTDLFFEDSAFKHAEYDAGHILHFHFLPFMKPYFQFIQGLEELLAERKLKEKYHHELFLDLYAIFKLHGFTYWKANLVERIMNRMKTEMISDLYHFPANPEFATINDSIWDELSSLPITNAVQKLKDL
jgi:hypothetical protein